jgi:hypothetical protein
MVLVVNCGKYCGVVTKYCAWMVIPFIGMKFSVALLLQVQPSFLNVTP